MAKTWDDEKLIKAVAESTSIRQVLDKLGLKPAGGNYKAVPERIKVLALDTSHFLGHAWSRGRTFQPRRPTEDLLVNGTYTQSHALRKRLIKEGRLIAVCSVCTLSEWLGSSIPLELDHIDGDRYNNTIENLRLLCPNCHAQTANYRGKNKGTYSNRQREGA